MAGVRYLYLGSYFANKLVPDCKFRIKIGVCDSSKVFAVLLFKALPVFLFFGFGVVFFAFHFFCGVLRLGNIYYNSSQVGFFACIIKLK